ncbi:unnamed protein product [Peronospora belbahrii]|uniref:Uncharacterized protein n=1 Tax=Peronospora belbahrii TaxID=622444 RepID=A0AAU9KYU4_9STRA|nr:unnamed protein product [Peronospora belbahrii]
MKLRYTTNQPVFESSVSFVRPHPYDQAFSNIPRCPFRTKEQDRYSILHALRKEGNVFAELAMMHLDIVLFWCRNIDSLLYMAQKLLQCYVMIVSFVYDRIDYMSFWNSSRHDASSKVNTS